MAGQTSDTVHRIVDQAATTVLAARAQAAERTSGGTERVKATGVSIVESAKEQLPHLQQRVNEQAIPAAHALAIQAQELAAVGAEKARDVSTRVNDDVLPTLRDVALNAASAAVELWEAARVKAAEAAQEAQTEIVPVAKYGLSAGSEKAKETGQQVATRVAESADHARVASRQAADATVSTSRDAAATLLWGAAAAGIVYYAFMDKDRREQTLRTLNGMIGGARELIRDVRGYDAEF